MITISIIGSSGSKDNMINFTLERINKMIIQVENIITTSNLSWDNIKLVSGGSSGADHIAVLLALKYKCKLILHLPCEYINDQFHDNGNYNYKYNCGKLLNTLHEKFSIKLGYDKDWSLKQINEILKNNEYYIYNGFLKRNIPVSKSQAIIAFTPSNSNKPKDGGTFHCWSLATTEYKIHINLLDL
jgi:hypothetical protein